MPISFDGPNKVIVLASGATEVNVSEIYSRWKDWVQTSDNAKFLPAFREVGGDPLGGGTFAAINIFIRNDLGWRVRPPEENINITLIGNIFPEDPNTVWRCSPLGTFQTSINTTNSVGLIVSSSSIETMAAAVLDEASSVETGLTVREALRLITAALAGKVSGAAGTTVTIRNAVADDKDRIVATVDSEGNRTSITVDTDP